MPNRKWTCPQCSSTKIGPERMRKVDARRYCLSCTEKQGVLVERECPVVEQRRQVRRTKAAKKAQTKTAPTPKLVAGLDLHKLLRTFWSLPAMVRARAEFGTPNRLPSLKIIRRNRTLGASGYASSDGISICVPKRVRPLNLVELLLHEVVHAALPEGTGHNINFRRVLCEAACEAFHIEIHAGEVQERGKYENRAYALDAEIVRRAADADCGYSTKHLVPRDPPSEPCRSST